MTISPSTHFKWVSVAQEVYEQHLKKPFTDPACEDDWDFPYQDQNGAEQVVQRPNHGLAHTLRCALYVPLVASVYRRCHQVALLSSQDIENIQLTLLFYVVGRENEVGSHQDPTLKFRHRSAEIFGKYVQAHLSSQLNETERRFYQKVLTDACDPHDPRYVITRISHNIDLLRCKEEKLYRSILAKTDPLIGDDEARKLTEVVKRCLLQTGDRIWDERDYDPLVFPRCSTNVYFCLRKIYQALLSPPPLPLPFPPSSSIPNTGKCLDLLCKLIEVEAIKQKSDLTKRLDAQVAKLLTFDERRSLDPSDRWFYKLAKRLIREDHQISSTVSDLLIRSLA